MRWVNREVIYKVYEIFEIEKISINTSRNLRSLDSRRFYELLYIIRNIYLIFINERYIKFYINNFIN